MLRIDDLDRERVRPEYVENIFRTLEWLGLDWDLGPATVEEFESQFSQRHRTDLYQLALRQLKERGDVFACSCSRKQLKELGAELVYHGVCLSKGLDLEGPDLAWRMDTSAADPVKMKLFKGEVIEETLPPSQDYFIVKRRDGLPAYHLASVADDVYFGVNTIVRGQDLFEGSVAQLWLAKKLGKRAFTESQFFHHHLILNDGEKLSKSQQSPSVLDEFYPDKGRLFRKLGSWMGLAPGQCESLDDMLKHFSTKHNPAGSLRAE